MVSVICGYSYVDVYWIRRWAMAEKFRKVNLWLTLEERRLLEELARRQGRSMSHVIRELVRQDMEKRQETEAKMQGTSGTDGK
jgi:hypothetical protein